MKMTKRIGNTTYCVEVVLTESGTQSLEDKLLRLVRNDPLATGDRSESLVEMRKGSQLGGTCLQQKIWKRMPILCREYIDTGSK